jgi:predicted permease
MGITINGRSGSRSRQFLYSVVTSNYFTALGIKPALGRLFQPSDGDHAGVEPMVVLGHAFWTKYLAADPNVVGTQIRISGRPVRIIGVTPPEFRGTFLGPNFEGYMLLSELEREARGKGLFTDRARHYLTVLGRLQPGVSISEAQAVMNAAMHRLGEQYAEDKGIDVRVIPEIWARPVPSQNYITAGPLMRVSLLSLAAMVLLIACLNVANLLLVRAAAREREMAVRAALGSGRGRLIRQALTESGLLAILGTAAGLLAGSWASQAFVRSIDFGSDFPIDVDFSFDWRVFTYSLVAAIVTGFAIGLVPALRASQAKAGDALHDGARGSTGARRQRLRSLLVVGQVAGSLVLLIAAGLFVRSLRNAQQMNLGFNPDGVLMVRMDPQWAGYNQQRTEDFYRELTRRVAALPGVRFVSNAFSTPLGYINSASWTYIPGQRVDPSLQPPLIGTNYVDGPYFDTLQIPIVEGRAFTDLDNASSQPVAIVNETMAQRYWPRQSSIGRVFRFRNATDPPVTIVGVAKKGKYVSISEADLPYFYVPLRQNYVSLRNLQIRADVPPEALMAAVEREIQTLDSEVAYADLQTMRQSLSGLGGFLLFRFGASQASAMGLIGLLLAIVGIYGVVSYGATLRTREIGIRMALGAQPRDVLQMILRQGTVLIVCGIAAGLAGAFALTRIIARFLPLVEGNGPAVFLLVTTALAAIAMVACYIPARRSTKINPTVALRHE